MLKEEKKQIIDALVEQLSTYSNVYLADVSTLTVERSNQLRRMCFQKDVKIQVAKNTLIKKAMEQVGKFEPLHITLKGSTAIMLSDSINAPAKIIKEFRKKAERPSLKGALVGDEFYIGDNQLDALVNIKTKNELIADVIALLQSPARNIISALQNNAEKKGGAEEAAA